MKILVTGGAGFIGSHVVDSYKKAGHEVAILDSLITGKRERTLHSKFYEGTIEDGQFVKEVIQDFKPEVINHHAAHISVVASTQYPLHDAKTNVLGTINLLEAARNAPFLKKFIYISSGGAMYGNPKNLPCP